MNNTKGRIFGRKKSNSRNSPLNEKIKGINISFERTCCSDSVVNSSSEHISSTSMNLSSDNNITGSSDCTDQESQITKGIRKPGNRLLTKSIENTTIINSDTSIDKINSCSDSGSPFSNLSPESSTSLLSDSSTSSNSKYKYKECFSSTQSSNFKYSKPTDSIDRSANYDCLRNLNQGNNLKERENSTTKRVEAVDEKPEIKLESYTRKSNEKNYRENAVHLNKNLLDIMNNKHSIREEKRTTQQVVAIENLDKHEKKTESPIPKLNDGLNDQKDNRCLLKESKICLNNETPFFIPIIIESNHCHQYSYLDYDVLIDCVCINDYFYLHSCAESLN